MYTGDTTLMCHQHLRTPFLNMRKLALIFKCKDLTLALDGIYISPRDDGCGSLEMLRSIFSSLSF